MEITEAACVCDELCRLKEEEEEFSEFRRFTCIKRVRDLIAILN